jgi:hypothetical protein
MSQENVEIVRAGYQFANRTGGIDFAVLHLDIVWHRADALRAVGVAE